MEAIRLGKAVLEGLSASTITAESDRLSCYVPCTKLNYLSKSISPCQVALIGQKLSLLFPLTVNRPRSIRSVSKSEGEKMWSASNVFA